MVARHIIGCHDTAGFGSRAALDRASAWFAGACAAGVMRGRTGKDSTTQLSDAEKHCHCN